MPKPIRAQQLQAAMGHHSRSSSIGTNSPFAGSANHSEVAVARSWGTPGVSGGETSGSQGEGPRHKLRKRVEPMKGLRKKAVSRSQELDPNWTRKEKFGRAGSR
jgi:hypothetical protein